MARRHSRRETGDPAALRSPAAAGTAARRPRPRWSNGCGTELFQRRERPRSGASWRMRPQGPREDQDDAARRHQQRGQGRDAGQGRAQALHAAHGQFDHQERRHRRARRRQAAADRRRPARRASEDDQAAPGGGRALRQGRPRRTRRRRSARRSRSSRPICRSRCRKPT